MGVDSVDSLWCCYLCFTTTFLWQLVSIILLKNNSQSSYICDTEVYLLTDDEGPFSFFNWIFINPERHKSDEIEEIMMHELTHCQQLHSIDIIFSELFCIIFWFNPFVWLLKREVRLNLEYLADNSVLAMVRIIKSISTICLG